MKVIPNPVTELPGGVIKDFCTTALDGDGNTKVSNNDILAAAGLEAVAAAVVAALPGDVAVIPKGIAVAADTLLKGLLLLAQDIKGIADDCQSQNFQNYVTDNLDEQVSTRASQTSMDNVQTTANTIQTKLNAAATEVTIIDNKVDILQQTVNATSSKVDQLLANLAAFQAQNLRLAIEANLSNGTNSAAIGLFELPSAQGGFLDLARSIVVDTIQKIQATGQGVGSAQMFLNKGDQQLAAGQFKNAYDSYRQAYQTATGH
jgi:hypothetical protein